MNKKADDQLSEEFKTDIRENGSKKNILGTLLAIIAIVLVFGTIGIAGYELVFKPEKIQTKTADEKIESRPIEKTETPAVQTPAPAPVPTTQPAFTEYTVVSGDSFSSIANTNGLTSAELMKYNNVTSEDLQIGQTLQIPKK